MAETGTQGWITCEAGRYPLLYSAPIRWTFKEGVSPVEEDFDMVPEHANMVLKNSNRPVTLTIQMPGVDPLIIKNLWVLGKRGSAVRYIDRIRLADRRRFLQRGKILGRYNIRREIGIQRIASTAQEVLQPVRPQIWFAPYSLKGYAPNKEVSDTDKWKPAEMLEDVMKKAVEIEKDYNKGSMPATIIRKEITDLNSAMSFEGLQIDDGADFGVQRALSFIPEAGLTVNKDGEYILYSKTNGRETYLTTILKPELENRGHISFVDNRNERPGKIEIFFTIECEVRFDYIEPTEVQAGATVVVIPPDARQLDNVGPSPDWVMTIAGENVVQGTWKTIEEYQLYWQPRSPWDANSPVTKKFLRRALCPYLDLWAPFLLTGLNQPDTDWAARAAMLQNNYRSTFRVPQRWMNNIFQIKAERVGIVDQATGSSGPAEAYCDYYKIATQRAFWRSRDGGRAGPSQRGEWAVNVRGYPQGGPAPWNSEIQLFDDNTKAIPADVVLLDPDQGVFHLEWKADQYRLYEMMGPSRIVCNGGNSLNPSADWADAENVPVSFDAVYSADVIPELEEKQKLAVLLKCIPASPNDTRQLFKMTVNPPDVKDMVPAAARTSLDNCAGPTWQVRVGGGMDGARAMIAWVDARYGDFEKLFGVQEGKPNLDGLVLNFLKPSRGIQTASLTTIAKAIAARIWARFMDRYQGSASGRINSGIEVDGWVGNVTHSIDGDGTAATNMNLPESLPDLPWYSILDASTRAILFREVRPRK